MPQVLRLKCNSKSSICLSLSRWYTPHPQCGVIPIKYSCAD